MRADGAMSFRLLGRTSPWCSVQSVGAQSRAAAWCSCLFQVNKPKNPVIEIPTVKWKEGGLLVRQGLPAVYHRVISRPLGIREHLLPTRVLMSLDQPMSPYISACQGLSELTLKINTEEDGDSSVGLCPRRPRLAQASLPDRCLLGCTSLGWLAAGWGVRFSLYIII